MSEDTKLESTLTCPECGRSQTETMPAELPVVLRMRQLRYRVNAEARGLLRVLFVRHGAVPVEAGRPVGVRLREHCRIKKASLLLELPVRRNLPWEEYGKSGWRERDQAALDSAAPCFITSASTVYTAAHAFLTSSVKASPRPFSRVHSNAAATVS